MELTIEQALQQGVAAHKKGQVEELEELFGPVLNAEEKEEAETLAGLIYSITGRIAKRGEIIRHGTGLEFEVLEADPRRLKTVRVRLPTKTPTPKTPQL